MGMEKLFKKLMCVKKCLRCWNKEIFGHISSKVKQAEEYLLQSEQTYDNLRGEVSRIKLGEARAVPAKQLSIEGDFWHQKSAMKWIQLGDANTTFVHSVVRQQRNSNFISRIKHDSGAILEEPSSIDSSAVEFFSTLFTSEREGRLLPA